MADGDVKEIAIEELDGFIDEGVVVIDVREDEELDAGMIDGAVHMPLSRFDEFSDEISQDKPSVFYCRSGRRSLKAAEIAGEWTDQAVYSLAGGYLAYSGEND